MANWKCPGCDSFNPDTVEICQYCGRDYAGVLEKVDGTPEIMQSLCPACRGRNPKDRRSCQWCGTELAIPSSPITKEAAEALSRHTEPSTPMPSHPPSPKPVLPAKPAQAASGQPVTFSSQKLRPCATCGLMLTSDDGIVVAGPRLLCPACFHEEFRSNNEESPPGKEASEEKAHTEEKKAGGPDASVLQPPLRKTAGIALLVGGVLLGGAGGALTYLFSFTWGFSPLALGALLVILGIARLTGR